MDLKQMVIQYNLQLKECLSLIYNELNQGQQKKLLKNSKVKELFEKYGVI